MPSSHVKPITLADVIAVSSSKLYGESGTNTIVPPFPTGVGLDSP